MCLHVSHQPVLNPLGESQKVLQVSGCRLQQSQPPSELSALPSLSFSSVTASGTSKGSHKKRGRLSSRQVKVLKLYPHSQIPFPVSGHLLPVKELNLFQIFPCMFERTVVTVLCTCGRTSRFSQVSAYEYIISFNASSNPGRGKNYILVRSLDFTCPIQHSIAI